MMEFLTAANNLPFSLALAMMLVLTVLEILGYLFGLSASGALDGLFEFDSGDADASELVTASLADRFLGWLHFGKVPVLILIAVFLVSFGFLGLLLQGVLSVISGFMLPWYLATAVVLPLSLPGVRIFGGALAKVLPRDETQVVSQASMIGRVATIVLGTARQGSPAQARVRDQHGQMHYVMLEPDDAADAFGAGDSVLLISHSGVVYRAIRNDNSALQP